MKSKFHLHLTLKDKNLLTHKVSFCHLKGLEYLFTGSSQALLLAKIIQVPLFWETNKTDF